MSKRPFNKEAYNACDRSAKLKIIELLEKNTKYRLQSNINEELYKKGDVIVSDGKNVKIIENEVRENFDKIVKNFDTIHIPIRKKNTPAHIYIVWKSDFKQFIKIKNETIKKYSNNIVNINCKCPDGYYTEQFLDIPKEETELYTIDENLKWKKINKNSLLAQM